MHWKLKYLPVFCFILLALLPAWAMSSTIAAKERWQEVKLEETGREFHPCVYITPDDAQLARENIEKYEWAKEYAERTIQHADGVVSRDPNVAFFRTNQGHPSIPL